MKNGLSEWEQSGEDRYIDHINEMKMEQLKKFCLITNIRISVSPYLTLVTCTKFARKVMFQESKTMVVLFFLHLDWFRKLHRLLEFMLYIQIQGIANINCGILLILMVKNYDVLLWCSGLSLISKLYINYVLLNIYFIIVNDNII